MLSMNQVFNFFVPLLSQLENRDLFNEADFEILQENFPWSSWKHKVHLINKKKFSEIFIFFEFTARKTKNL